MATEQVFQLWCRVKSILLKHKGDNNFIAMHRIIFVVGYVTFIIFGMFNFTATGFGMIYFIISVVALPWCLLNISRCYKFLNVVNPILLVFVLLCLYNPQILTSLISSAVPIFKVLFFGFGVIAAIVLICLLSGKISFSDRGSFNVSRQEAKRNEEMLREHMADERRRERERKGGSL